MLCNYVETWKMGSSIHSSNEWFHRSSKRAFDLGVLITYSYFKYCYQGWHKHKYNCSFGFKFTWTFRCYTWRREGEISLLLVLRVLCGDKEMEHFRSKITAYVLEEEERCSVVRSFYGDLCWSVVSSQDCHVNFVDRDHATEKYLDGSWTLVDPTTDKDFPITHVAGVLSQDTNTVDLTGR